MAKVQVKSKEKPAQEQVRMIVVVKGLLSGTIVFEDIDLSDFIDVEQVPGVFWSWDKEDKAIYVAEAIALEMENDNLDTIGFLNDREWLNVWVSGRDGEIDVDIEIEVY